jgi:transposase-like protein
MCTDLSLCFKDECAALELIEACVWPNGVVCPHCGENRRTSLLRGFSTKTGTHKCYGCRKLFSVRTGTMLECSHVPFHKWLKALFLTGCGTEPIKPFQLSRAINVSFKTAVLMLAQIELSAVECGIRTSDDKAETTLPAHELSTLAPSEFPVVGEPQISTVNSHASASHAGASLDAKAT